MYVLNIDSAAVRKYEGGVVADKEITVANVEDLANKVPGGKLLLELYNKSTGESVKKFSSRGQGLNRLWKQISGSAQADAAPAELDALLNPPPKPYIDKNMSKKLERAARKGKVVGTIKPKAKEVTKGVRGGKYTGRKLVKKADTNPRRANTFGWRSWEAYKSGTKYEDALKAGARRVDIEWDIKHGHLEVA